MEAEATDGDLGYHNINTFDLAMKVSGHEKLYYKNEGWCIFPIQYGVGKLFELGSDFLKKLTERVLRKVWGKQNRTDHAKIIMYVCIFICCNGLHYKKHTLEWVLYIN